MLRNQYDTDVTTFSPQGRIHQIEYASEAVKQGSAVVGARSGTHAVLACVKRSVSDLASHQRKIFELDTHVGVAVSGIIADARVLSKFMRNECLQHRFAYESAVPVGRLVRRVADYCQRCTQRASKRPFGVGLLVAGVDELGPHLFETCPSGEEYELWAMALGARSQSAKTYLERHLEEVKQAKRDELIRLALAALRETFAAVRDAELTEHNCMVAVVGIEEPFRVYEDAQVAGFLEAIRPAPEPDGGLATGAPSSSEERMEDTS